MTIASDFEELRELKELAQSTIPQPYLTQFGKWVSCYSGKVTNGVISVIDGISRNILGMAPAVALADFLMPVDYFCGNRAIFIPSWVDKVLGFVFFALEPKDHLTYYTSELKNILVRLKNHNPNILYQGQGSNNNFNYEIAFKVSSIVNAFCLPGGKIMVYSALYEKIVNNTIKQVRVKFEDGAWADVSVEKVRKEDILAALIGHELTHAAARHSMLRLAGKIMTFPLAIGVHYCIAFLKSKDVEYQDLLKKRKDSPSLLTVAEKQKLEKKEASFDKAEIAVSWCLSKIQRLVELLCSREHEYEADIVGTFMASKAGYNPLGALVLQEILGEGHWSWLEKVMEFFSTHPCTEHRKRVALVAAARLDPTSFQESILSYQTNEKKPGKFLFPQINS